MLPLGSMLSERKRDHSLTQMEKGPFLPEHTTAQAKATEASKGQDRGQETTPHFGSSWKWETFQNARRYIAEVWNTSFNDAFFAFSNQAFSIQNIIAHYGLRFEPERHAAFP